MVKPDFGRIHGVPMAAFSGLKEKVDAGSRGPPLIRRDPGLAVVTALRVGREIEVGNDGICCHRIILGTLLCAAKWEARG